MRVSDLPPELANIPQHLVLHSYTTGSRGRYHWLQSNSFKAVEFFEAIRPPQMGFRQLTFDADFFPRKGWTVHGEVGIGPRFYDWNDLDWCCEQVEFFIVNHDFEPGNRKLSSPGLYAEHLNDESLEPVHAFWRMVDEINPLIYVAEGYFFTAVINDQAAFQSLIESAPFSTVEQRKRDELFQYVRSTELAECGEEKCLEPGCTRLRIRQAVLCWVHQFLWAHPDWKYANTPKS